jgi:hypothetical protein
MVSICSKKKWVWTYNWIDDLFGETEEGNGLFAGLNKDRSKPEDWFPHGSKTVSLKL